MAIRNSDAEGVHCDVLADETFIVYRTKIGDRFATVAEIGKSEFKADVCISYPPYYMKWEQPVFAQLLNNNINATTGINIRYLPTMML